TQRSSACVISCGSCSAQPGFGVLNVYWRVPMDCTASLVSTSAARVELVPISIAMMTCTAGLPFLDERVSERRRTTGAQWRIMAHVGRAVDTYHGDFHGRGAGPCNHLPRAGDRRALGCRGIETRSIMRLGSNP